MRERARRRARTPAPASPAAARRRRRTRRSAASSGGENACVGSATTSTRQPAAARVADPFERADLVAVAAQLVRERRVAAVVQRFDVGLAVPRREADAQRVVAGDGQQRRQEGRLASPGAQRRARARRPRRAPARPGPPRSRPSSASPDVKTTTPCPISYGADAVAAGSPPRRAADRDRDRSQPAWKRPPASRANRSVSSRSRPVIARVRRARRRPIAVRVEEDRRLDRPGQRLAAR